MIIGKLIIPNGPTHVKRLITDSATAEGLSAAPALRLHALNAPISDRALGKQSCLHHSIERQQPTPHYSLYRTVSTEPRRRKAYPRKPSTDPWRLSTLAAKHLRQSRLCVRSLDLIRSLANSMG
jgi:hypothetical protein